MAVLIVVHMQMAQFITKDLDTLLIKSQGRGVEQVVMRMQVLHQEGMEDTVEEDIVAVGTVEGMEDTDNQWGG